MGEVQSPNAHTTFDRLATEYDELKLKLIPHYEHIRDLVLRYALRSSPNSVLELGSGTGQFASLLLAANPRLRYQGVEFAPNMRELASARLKRFGARYRLTDLDLNCEFPAGPFDAVVSLFAIHHVRDRPQLARHVKKALTPGGIFAYADITAAATPSEEPRLEEHWIAFMRGAGLPPDRVRAVLADHRDNDLPESAPSQLAHLQRVGFESPQILWEEGKFAVFGCWKPSLAA